MCYNSVRISADPKQFGGTTMITVYEYTNDPRKEIEKLLAD